MQTIRQGKDNSDIHFSKILETLYMFSNDKISITKTQNLNNIYTSADLQRGGDRAVYMLKDCQY